MCRSGKNLSKPIATREIVWDKPGSQVWRLADERDVSGIIVPPIVPVLRGYRGCLYSKGDDACPLHVRRAKKSTLDVPAWYYSDGLTYIVHLDAGEVLLTIMSPRCEGCYQRKVLSYRHFTKSCFSSQPLAVTASTPPAIERSLLKDFGADDVDSTQGCTPPFVTLESVQLRSVTK